MDKKKILIIDDESPIADMIAEFCESFGFESRVMGLGEDVLEAVKSYVPDLITMDLRMPGESGIEMIGKLKDDPATKEIPVVVISSYANVEEAHESLSMSAGILQKPLNRNVLGGHLKAILGKAS